MPLTIGEKVKIILKRKKMKLADLAELTGQSRQNLSNKMNRDNFSEKEIYEIAKALNCTFENRFVLNDTKETI